MTAPATTLRPDALSALYDAAWVGLEMLAYCRDAVRTESERREIENVLEEIEVALRRARIDGADV